MIQVFYQNIECRVDHFTQTNLQNCFIKTHCSRTILLGDVPKGKQHNKGSLTFARNSVKRLSKRTEWNKSQISRRRVVFRSRSSHWRIASDL